jgi:type IV secretory pathway VirJ component
MKHRVLAVLGAALLLAGSGAQAASPATSPATSPETITHGRFNDLPVYKPAGPVKGFALLLSGAAGWDAAARVQAEALARQGTMVAGIDTAKLLANLEADKGKCVMPDGDMENLSRFIQAYEHLPTYFPPILVGQGAGASLAYAMNAQAPVTRFGGLLTVDFCPVLPMQKPLCNGEGVHFEKATSAASAKLLPAKKLDHPWIALQDPQAAAPVANPACTPGAAQAFIKAVPGVQLQAVTLPARRDDAAAPWVGAYTTAFNKLNAERPAAPPVPPATIADLPVIEIPSKAPGDTLVILLSGDGGWAGLDRDVAASLLKMNVPTVGLDSLRYFWSKRTPASVTADMDRLIRFYLTRWNKSKVILVGYSQGADVLPFVMNRMPAATRKHIPQTVLMGLGKKAAFEFQVTNWISAPSNGLPIAPETEKLAAGTTTCIYGLDEAKDSGCPTVDPAKIKVVALPGGHHFDGDYDKLARIILSTR